MNIAQVETLTGMTRANIRYYEEQGLLAPARLKNGYRDYAQREVDTLRRIKLLRSLQISIEDIRALQKGDKPLARALDDRLLALSGEQKQLERADGLLRAMRRDNVEYASLDAEKYLRGIPPQQGRAGYFSIARDETPHVFYPWRRYFAYTLDYSLCTLLWLSILALGFGVNLFMRSKISGLIDILFTQTLLLLLEPLFLTLFGATPGKWLFGLNVQNAEGGRLSYRAGLSRAWQKLSEGLGFGIPAYSLYRLWKSYKTCTDNEDLPWDAQVRYTIRDTRSARYGLWAAATALTMFVTVYLMAYSALPPCRGEVTVAQFARNFNFAMESLGYEADYVLDERGAWARAGMEGDVVIQWGLSFSYPDFVFETDENGHIEHVGYRVSAQGNQEWITGLNVPMAGALYALAGAQRATHAFPILPTRVAKALTSMDIRDFSYTLSGVTLSCQASVRGYDDGMMDQGWLIARENAPDYAFDMEVSLTK